MRPLAATELLDVWERGRASPPWQKALLLLAASCPEYTQDMLARLIIGRRDGLLFQLRDWTFGSQISSVVQCPACNNQLEFAFDSREIQAENDEVSDVVDFQITGYQGRVRLPNTDDLVAVMDLSNREIAQRALLAACLVEVTPVSDAGERGEAISATAHPLPPDVEDAIVQCMQEADARADIQFSLLCPACDHKWSALFDVVSFFWQEIDDWAWRTLREVHALAAVHGWSENEILSMSAWRRRVYLEMVQG